MNRAQTLTPLGNGCFAWREDLPVCQLRRHRCSVLAFELLRYHHLLEHPSEPARQRMARAEVRAFASRAVELLREVHARLTFGEICRRLSVTDSKSRTLRRVMDRLCDGGAVRSFGSYRKLYESSPDN